MSDPVTPICVHCQCPAFWLRDRWVFEAALIRNEHKHETIEDVLKSRSVLVVENIELSVRLKRIAMIACEALGIKE
jgi:putative flippase GtrA